MSEKTQARLAFIGCGAFASASLMPNIPWIPEVDFVAACDLDRAKAEAAQRKWGARTVYTDLEHMLDIEQPDGVFVIGPAPLQHQLIPQVLRRGIPVYSEKPIANTSAEAQELLDLARNNHTWGQAGFMKRFAYGYGIAHDFMQREEFGTLNMIAAKFTQGPYPDLWGMEAKRAFLVGQQVHLCDLVQYFAGHPVRVHALYREHSHTQMGYMANIEFEGGVIGQVNFNGMDARPGRDFLDIKERVELTGTGCLVQIDDMTNVLIQGGEEWCSTPGGAAKLTREWRPTGVTMPSQYKLLGYHDEVRHFALKCIGKAQGGPEFEDCVWALKLGEAIYDSAHSGDVVQVR